MKFNEDILKQITWEEVVAEQIIQQETPLDKMKKYLIQKHPHIKSMDLSGFWLSDLYRFEARLEFNEIQLRRFKRTEKFGHSKICPINKFNSQPTLF